MVVDVLGVGLHALEGLAPVVAAMEIHVHLVDAVEGVRAREDLLIVVGAGAAREVVPALLPAFAAVFGAPESAGLIRELDGRVDHVRPLRRDGETDLALVARGQAGGQLAPGVAAVLRFVDARARTAVEEHRDVAQALPAHGIENVGITGIEMHLAHARVGVVFRRVAESVAEHLYPALAAVAAAVEPALTAAGPKRPLGGHEYGVGVSRIDPDHADVFAVAEPHVFPGAAAVTAAVDARAIPHMPAGNVLAGA